MWTIAYYLSTSLFSLRPALSTASGAQSLLVPTPYAIKMALINAAIQRYGIETSIEWWPTIRSMRIAIDVPDVAVVNKTFIKIQRPTRVTKSNQQEVDEAKAAGIFPMGPTIAFREFVQFSGNLGIALTPQEQSSTLPLSDLLMQINYLGKRGGFFQLQTLPEAMPELEAKWTVLTQPSTAFAITGTLQMLDDCGPNLSWDHINIYHPKSISLGGKERVLHSIVLPYELRRSSYHYSLYERALA